MFQLDRVLLIVIEHVWISKFLRFVTWKGCREVKKWVITLVFANWTVLAPEETFLSLCRSFRATIFGFNSKTQWQMFLLIYGRHVCVPQKDTNMGSPYTELYKFGWFTSTNNARMKNSRDLILGEVVHISIIYVIQDSWLYSLNGYDFSFDHMTSENRE